MIEKREYDLEERLLKFSQLIIKLAESLPKTDAGRTISNQITRSGISFSLNYSESLSSESKKDFIHKLKISMKELRETYTLLKLIKINNFVNKNRIDNCLNECDQLIAIIYTSIQTTSRRLK